MHEIQPTLEELAYGRKTFEEHEPRDLFYRAATELVALALRGDAKLSPAEAVAVLLQTWNVTYYRFRGGFTREHFEELEQVIAETLPELLALRDERIEEVSDERRVEFEQMFSKYEDVVGPVGAAKTLHLFAPFLFPLWDNRIAEAYGLRLSKPNADRYWRFMLISREQSRAVFAEGFAGNPLKALDEYNYCRFTQGWI